jgi:outer membrane protein OmpU
MKKVLLGTSALLGAGLVASPAFAADGIKLSVGGYFRTAYQINFDDDSEGEPGNEHNTDGFFSDSEIYFRGSTTLDNGLEVGARVELEGEDDSDQIDEAWVFFSGGFGEIHIGSEDNALANDCIMPPGGTANFSAFSPNQWGANTFTTNSVCAGVDDRGDAQKIYYVTPNFGGFQVAMSYTPSGGDERHIDTGGPHLGMPANNDGESRHNLSLYATYSYEGAGWGLTAGAGAGFEGHVEQESGADRKESDYYQAGLNLSFGSLAFGVVGEYFNDINSREAFGADPAIDRDGWAVGAGIAYTMDSFTIGAQYSHGENTLERSEGGDDSEATLDRIVLTGNYALGPGINLDAELGYTWQDTEGEDFGEENDNYDSFEIGIGTAFTF